MMFLSLTLFCLTLIFSIVYLRRLKRILIKFNFQKLSFVPIFILSFCLAQCDQAIDDTEIEATTETLVLSTFNSECDHTQDSDFTITEDDDVVTEDDQTVLDCKISTGSDSVGLSNSINSALFSLSPSISSSAGSLNLELVATVNAPTVNGTALGATDTFYDGGYGLVTYNTPGAEYQGAIQLIDISNPLDPSLVFESVLATQDVSAGVIDGEILYLATAQSVDLTGNPSASELQVVNLDDEGFPDEFLDPLNLPSFVATDILVRDASIYATTGNTGGVYRIDIDNTDEIAESLELEDARSVAIGEGSEFLYVFQGTDGRVTIADPETLESSTFEVGGATIAEAKSTIQYENGFLFIGAGDGGVLVVNPETEEIVGELANPESDDEDVVTSANAVSVYEDLLFVSNGEFGIRVVAWEENSSGEIDFEVIGTLTFGDEISANDITFENDYLFVAAGQDGLKIIKVIRSPYINAISCDNFPNAVFCDDFVYSDGTQINDDIIWKGKDSKKKANAYAIDEGVRILRKKYITTKQEFKASSDGKHFSVKLYKSGIFTVESERSKNHGVKMSYNGSDEVTAYIGKINSSRHRIEVDFEFDSGQDYVVAHVYQEGTQFQVALEFSDGSILTSQTYNVSGSRMTDARIIRLAPFSNADQSSSASSFDDVLVEEFSFSDENDDDSNNDDDDDDDD